MRFSLIVDSDHAYAAVEKQVRNALLNPETGLFGPLRLSIGESIFESEIVDACLRVAGVNAVHGLLFADAHSSSGPRFDPGEGGYYVLYDTYLQITNG